MSDNLTKEGNLERSDAPNQPASKHPPVNDPRLSDLNFLVIDDDPFEQKLLGTILKKLGGKNVEVVGGGQAALDRLSANTSAIDVALCDLKMPDIDGLEFVRRISQFSNAPAIIFASGADNAICRVAEQVGEKLGIRILGSVTKPAAPQTLLDLIIKVFDSGQLFGQFGAGQHIQISEEQAKAGLNNDHIEMHYQPKIAVITGEIVGFESLARWRDPEKGILGPGAFIPTIERHGLLNRLTDVVITKTLEDLCGWNPLFPELQVSINVAAENLSNLELPNFVVNTAKSLSVSPNRITLEVTESGVASDVTVAMEILARLRLNDIRLSIDDFGTGYASLDKLKDLPFSELKIDRGFVQGAANNESAMAVLEIACDLGKKLGLNIVAEGVETQTQWDLVAKLGCDAIQGFFISKPIPRADVPDWIADWSTQRNSVAVSS
jgi:EAL domain-containing protein (putative c-di-GMP-specific phosphodiesterase class I)/ActR/RegA family two-component response regulator